MSRVETVRRQLHGAETLQTVVSTMKTLASVRIGQYRHAVEALDASGRTIELALQSLLQLYPELLDADRVPEGGPVAAVVFGSDRGLCGPFAERIARHADGLLRDRTAHSGPPTLLAVGRRMLAKLQELGWPVERKVDPPGSLSAVDASAREVLSDLNRWREEGRAERLFLIHARPTGGASYEAYALQLLPLDPSWLHTIRDRAWPSRRLPSTLGEARPLLRGVIRQLVAHALVQAFAASQASENAARLAAMEAAERNVEERIDQLRTRYQAARQSSITAELLDIQAAYAASSGGGPR